MAGIIDLQKNYRVGLKAGGNPLSWILRILLNQGDDDEPNWFQNKAQNFTGGIRDIFKYRPATQGASGYTPAQLNQMNALGGYYSEPARNQRRLEKRQLNILNRAAADKAVGNVNKLLGQYGYTGTPGSGTLQFRGTPQGDPSAGAGYSRSDDSWSRSPFKQGGLATMFERRR